MEWRINGEGDENKEGGGKKGVLIHPGGEVLRSFTGVEPGFMEPEVYTTGGRVSSLKKTQLQN